MFRKTLCVVTVSAVSFVSQAVETLDVMVVFDKNTINNYSSLNTSTKRTAYASKLVANLNVTMQNSDLGNVIRFNRVATKLWTFTEQSGNEYEDIVEIKSRYFGYLPDMIDSGNPRGILYQLQKAYSADVVIAVLHEGTQNEQGLNGIAITTPDRNDPFGSNPHDLQQFAGLGLFFIAAKDENLNNERLAGHEFGHTAGLFHLPIEPISDGDDLDHTSEWLIHGAAGYKHDVPWGIDRTTIMVNSSNASFSSGKENQYSDINNQTCGKDNNLPCGDVNSNAVQTLRTFASDLNKRGNWYK